MFGSQILEVGIGLILVFLLVSLILTAVRETIESLYKTRARDLEQAIAELLDDPDGTGLRGRLYNHPLVYALFPGGVKPTVFTAKGALRSRGRRNLPAYIPRESFALALEDLISEGNVSAKVQTAYDALARAAGGDPARIRKGVEAWFDASMDRASGWFKRRTQWILFWLGLTIAVALNINAITIGQYLATNAAARKAMVELAGDVQRERTAPAAARTASAEPATADTPWSGGGGEAANIGSASGDAPATPKKPDAAADEAAEADEAARIARDLAQRVRTVGMPVGWDRVQVESVKEHFRGRGWFGWLSAALGLLLGYLMVAFAGTLGAPFWFDLLGKFMVVRSTVKPREKSPDESSKDGGTGGSPRPAAAEKDKKAAA